MVGSYAFMVQPTSAALISHSMMKKEISCDQQDLVLSIQAILTTLEDSNGDHSHLASRLLAWGERAGELEVL